MFSSFTKPNVILRLEGLALFLVALVVYWQQGFSWPLFWSIVFLPDLALVGYLVNPRVGAVAYNATHSKLMPGILLLASLLSVHPMLTSVGLIWLIHIGVDRLFGYGLKYPEGFKHTHLGAIGPMANRRLGRFSPCGR